MFFIEEHLLINYSPTKLKLLKNPTVKYITPIWLIFDPLHRELAYSISLNSQIAPNLVVKVFSLNYFIKMGNDKSNNSQTHVR